MQRFLLDTNILLGLARKADWARGAYSQFNLGDPDVISFTSVVCKGEILAMDLPRFHGRLVFGVDGV